METLGWARRGGPALTPTADLPIVLLVHGAQAYTFHTSTALAAAERFAIGLDFHKRFAMRLDLHKRSATFEETVVA